MNLTCEHSAAVYLLSSQNVQKKEATHKTHQPKKLHKPPKVNQTLKKQTQQTTTCQYNKKGKQKSPKHDQKPNWERRKETKIKITQTFKKAEGQNL